MIIKKQKIMTIGKQINGLVLTKEVIEKSIKSYYHKPVVLSEEQKIIGYISGNIIIEDDGVYADITLWDDRYKNEHEEVLNNFNFQNWTIQMNLSSDKFTFSSIDLSKDD